MKLLTIKPLALFMAASAVVALTGCGNAETTINEKPSIPAEDEHNHGGEPNGQATGRLLVINPVQTQAQVYDLSDNDLMTTIALDALPSAVYATAGYRFAALIERSADKVGFIDGGLWQEAHNDHFDLVTSMPALSNFSLTGSRPTHFVSHDDHVALFLDGDTATGNNAGIQVFSDPMIEEASTPATLDLLLPQHGVAEPRGEHLIVSIRRDDAVSTSSNFILPDQVGVYHLHDGSYELEQTFAETCPDLHGAAQNETHVVFGCSDGVLLVADNGDNTYSAQKILNTSDMADGLRIGSLWGHHDSGQFIAQANSRTSDTVQFFVIDPSEQEISLIDWKPMPSAKPVMRDFAFEAEQFVILDDQGYITLIEPHDEGEHTHWEYGARLDITEADVTTMPEAMTFSMTFAQNSHTAYIADPIAQHILTVDLELLEIIDDIELDYAPANVTWLGIAPEHE